MDNVTVSIYCLTYNHAKYIRDTFEGFLHQKTNFKYKVFVFDDASTDGTSDIIREYKEHYPDIFDIYISPVNTYYMPERKQIQRNLFQKYITGKYAAICEGDDYWIDADKLQTQVDYMESHPECSMSVHACMWLDSKDNEFYKHIPYAENKILTDEDIIMGHGMLPTASMVMRRDVFLYDKAFPVCSVGDYPLQLYAITKGCVFYFNRIMSVYRYRHQGSWSESMQKDSENRMMHCLDMVEFLNQYNKYTNFVNESIIREKQSEYLYNNVRTNEEMSSEEYRLLCREVQKKTSEDYINYINDQCRIFTVFKGEYVPDKETEKIINKYKYVVIMGNGNYACYIDKMMKNNNIHYDGHIVTKFHDEEEKLDNIWELDNYPYDKEDTMVIIGISQTNEADILKSLKDNGYNNILAPLWFEI